jgi:uncharacterized protein YbaR (Trm112 family)
LGSFRNPRILACASGQFVSQKPGPRLAPASLPAPNLFSRRQSTDKLETSMAISKELLEILVCPVCKAKVILKEDGSGLKCVECKRVYPVRDDIPVMLVDQATVEP